MDIVFIHDLRIETVIGIYDWERKIRQTVSIDLEMGWDTARAAASDRIEYALDYEKVAKEVTRMIQEGKYRLVERLGDEVARMIARSFHVPWVRITVTKPDALGSAALEGLVPGPP